MDQKGYPGHYSSIGTTWFYVNFALYSDHLTYFCTVKEHGKDGKIMASTEPHPSTLKALQALQALQSKHSKLGKEFVSIFLCIH